MALQLPQWENIRALHAADPEQKSYTLLKYYSSFFCRIYTKRLELTLDLLGDEVFDKLLDVGFGSGVFFVELSRRCNKLYGIDLHRNIPQVCRMGRREQLETYLSSAEVGCLPFRPEEFDCVVSVSTFEFLDDVEGALRQIHTVLKPGGIVVVGVPVINSITNFLYLAVGLREHEELHKADHRLVQDHFQNYFELEKVGKIPAFLPLDQGLYALWRGRKSLAGSKMNV